MAELRDDYLDYLTTSGLLDEERFAPHEESRSRRPSSSMRERGPGESLPMWGGGDVSTDIGLIDPVDVLAGVLASPALSGVKALGTRMAEPGPLPGSLLRSQRGSISDVTSADERLRMLRTARARGNVGQDPTLVTRALMERVAPHERILDYGAGKGARQTQLLRDAGYQSVTPTDLPESIALSEGLLESIAPGTTYDTVMASNVLNVQPHREALEETLREIVAYLRPEGRALLNYPASPRNPGLTPRELDTLLRAYFREVARVGGTSSAPVFEGLYPIPRGR